MYDMGIWVIMKGEVNVVTSVTLSECGDFGHIIIIWWLCHEFIRAMSMSSAATAFDDV